MSSGASKFELFKRVYNEIENPTLEDLLGLPCEMFNLQRPPSAMELGVLMAGLRKAFIMIDPDINEDFFIKDENPAENG